MKILKPTANIDKVKLVLSHMDGDFWNKITASLGAGSEQMAVLLAEFNDVYTKLSVCQAEILEARYSGYNRLVENTKPTATAKIIKENKVKIGALTERKAQLMSELSDLLARLQVQIESAATLGEKEKSGN